MDLADHVRTRCQRFVAFLGPAGGAALIAVLAQVHVGAELTQGLIDVPPHIEEVDLGVHQNAFRVDEIGPTQRKACIANVDPKGLCQITGGVCAHGEFCVLEFLLILLPGQMSELRVAAHRDQVGTE